MEKEDYEPPKIVDYGSIADLTQHTDPLHPEHPIDHLTSSITG